MKTIGRFLIGIVYFIIIILVSIGMHVYVAITVSVDYLKKGISLSDMIALFITLLIITTKLMSYGSVRNGCGSGCSRVMFKIVEA